MNLYKDTSRDELVPVTSTITLTHEVEQVDFEMRDEKYRRVGIKLHRATVTMVEIPAAERLGGYSVGRPGVWYSLSAQATRDGSDYGASNSSHDEVAMFVVDGYFTPHGKKEPKPEAECVPVRFELTPFLYVQMPISS
ncbi:MAG: hypothetical protein ACRDP6_14195 [Actinoallomurus sp.]